MPEIMSRYDLVRMRCRRCRASGRAAALRHAGDGVGAACSVFPSTCEHVPFRMTVQKASTPLQVLVWLAVGALAHGFVALFAVLSRYLQVRIHHEVTAVYSVAQWPAAPPSCPPPTRCQLLLPCRHGLSLRCQL